MQRIFFAILFAALLVIPNSLFAQDNQYMMQEKEVMNIENISLSVSQLTGAAISPLLVTGAIGAYKYISSPTKDARKQLPWYFQPWFFTICLLITVPALIASTTSLFNIDPKITKVLDVLNKKIGLLLVTPILFEIISPFSTIIANNVQTAFTNSNANFIIYASAIPTEFLAAIPVFIWFLFITVSLVFVFFAIWLFNYILDIIIFLCPFGWADAILKIIRGTYFSLLIFFTFIYPPLGLILTLPIIILSVVLFGWSIRRAIMGIVFIFDFISRRKETVIGNKGGKGIIAFSEAGLNMPAKRMGVLSQEHDKWFFTFRKYFLFEKTIIIKKTESLLRKGLLFFEIRQNSVPLCSLPPRYQHIDEQIQSYLKIDKIEESKLKKDIKSVIAWIKNQFSQKTTTN